MPSLIISSVIFLLRTIPITYAFVLKPPTNPLCFTTKRSNISSHHHPKRRTILASSSNDDNKSEEQEQKAESLRKQAEQIRNDIRRMEDELQAGGYRPQQPPSPSSTSKTTPTLNNKTILVIGANGRLGSMVCRHLLRTHPQTKVIAAVHTASETSNRGTSRLSYEVGAEDGQGYIGPAWSEEEDTRNARFEYTDAMSSYNLQNLRIVEVELLDPVQCNTIVNEVDVDAVIWCATDFDGNQPRAVSGLNVAFLFRAVASFDKGRVEVEGLRNVLGVLAESLTRRKKRDGLMGGGSRDDGVTSFVLVSTSPYVFSDFVTPAGTFNGLKREGEDILNEFPSLKSCVLRMGIYEDNFVKEDLDVKFVDSRDEVLDYPEDENEKEIQNILFRKSLRKINRRDAARVVVESLTNSTLVGKRFDIFTAVK